MDMRKPSGNVANSLLLAMFLAVFITSLFCYVAVWIKLRRNAKRLKRYAQDAATVEKSKNTQRTAKTMTAFVIVYIVQWSTYIVYTIWNYYVLPPPPLFLSTVITANAGGVFNAFAYTLIRKWYGRSAGGQHGDSMADTATNGELSAR